jgi:hypothetical protein
MSAQNMRVSRIGRGRTGADEITAALLHTVNMQEFAVVRP